MGMLLLLRLRLDVDTLLIVVFAIFAARLVATVAMTL